ncbi:MAG: radical SAM protein [bacterium]|nr:radical SAM protein [bacterium]
MFESYEYDGPSSAVPIAVPYVLALRVTERCHTGCGHCYLGAGPQGEEMGLGLVRAVVRQASELSIRTIHVTGGEPLLHAELEEIVGTARSAGLMVEMVTSIFSPGQLAPPVRLRRLAHAGLERVMVSYDDWHARVVSLRELAAFLDCGLTLGLDVAVNVVEQSGSTWTCDTLLHACAGLFQGAESVDWLPAQISSIGRAAASGLKESIDACGARCAFSLTSPTVTPSGEVVVCCNAKQDTPGMKLGKIGKDSLACCLNRLAAHPLARINAVFGPHRAWPVFGNSLEDAPSGTCASCQMMMKQFSDCDAVARLETLSRSLPAELPLDFEALNTWCRRAIPKDATRTYAVD